VKRIALFTRPPVPGLVKTRLSPALPPALAAGLYAALFDDTLDAVRGCRADERTVWWPGDTVEVHAPQGFESRRQSGTGVGERLAHAASELLRESGDRVLLLTSGVPALRAKHLDEAFAALDSADLVLGPATDGGTWLVGLTREVPALFEELARGVPDEFDRTLAAATRAGLNVRTTTRLDALETPHEFVRIVAADATGHTHVFGLNARAFLARIGMLPD
jgi:uncharacterized protein